MKAAILRAFGDPLSVEEVPEPVPGPDEVLLRVRAAGLCGSDLKVVSGKLPGVATPLIPGHEVAGELTDPVGELPAGTPVAAYVFSTCGTCPSCRRGEGTVCPQAQRIGFERDGGLAEYIAVPRANVLPFSAELGFDRAAVSMDAVLTPWHAIRTRGNVQRGDRVLIVGVGGLGLHAVQVAKALGAHVAVMDPLASHRDAALSLGADIAAAPDEAGLLKAWAPDGIDVALESSGQADGFRSACELVRPAGRIVCCGYQPSRDYAVDSTRLALAELMILGSRGGSIDDARDALAAVGAGQLKPLLVGHGTLADVNDMLEQLRSGAAVGRLAVDL